MKTLHNPTAAERHAFSVLDRLHRGEGLGSLWRKRPELAVALRLLDRRCGFTAWADDPTTPAGEGMRRHIWHSRADHPPLTQDEVTAGCDLAEVLIIGARWELHPETPAEVVQRAVAEVLDPIVDELGALLFGSAEDPR